MFSWLKSLFSAVIRAFKKFIAKVFTSATQRIIGELKDYAVEVVSTLEDLDLTNEKRRKEAFKQIKEEAEKRAIEIRDSVINLLIEMAVQYIKNT